MLTVPIVLLLAAAVILVGVVGVAMGGGGEMAEFASDYPLPTSDDVVTADDVASVRPPSSLWGYNVQVTDEALHRIAQVVTERDVEIAVLRQQLAELRAATGLQQPVPAEFRPVHAAGAEVRDAGRVEPPAAAAEEPASAAAARPDAGISDHPAAIAPDVAATDDPAAVASGGSAGELAEPAEPAELAEPTEPAESAERIASRAEGARRQPG